mmetsp:Transcript_18271/g.34699  ORF Transcript_18271/g.34699 Transcript_18271/m.34699 type:complete len:153 (+) Transcript_18271:1403-1861(+)
MYVHISLRPGYCRYFEYLFEAFCFDGLPVRFGQRRVLVGQVEFGPPVKFVALQLRLWSVHQNMDLRTEVVQSGVIRWRVDVGALVETSSVPIPSRQVAQEGFDLQMEQVVAANIALSFAFLVNVPTQILLGFESFVVVATIVLRFASFAYSM